MLWLLLACKDDEPTAGGPVTADFATCEGEETRSFDEAPTWDEVGPIVAENCVTCHTAEGIAGIALDTHAEAARWAPAMASAVGNRTMPPWPARNCDTCATYRDARWLTDDEVATIVAWAAGGALPGDGADPPLAAPDDTEHLGDEATATLPIPFAYTPDPSVLDDYRCFVVDPGLAADRFVTAVEILPDQVQEVHHVLVYVTTDPAGDAAADALNRDEDGDGAADGYRCDGGPGVSQIEMVAGWAPGTGVLRYPEGTGLRLPAGRRMIAQIHYNTANGVTPDQTAVAVKLQDDVPFPAQFLQITAARELVLEPGQPAIDVVHREVPGGGGRVWGAAGHMHRLGTALSIRSDRGGCALDIPRWDFDWQMVYFLDQPYESADGEEVELRCTFDTTSVTEEVRWGEGTNDEMCVAFLYVSE